MAKKLDPIVRLGQRLAAKKQAKAREYRPCPLEHAEIKRKQELTQSIHAVVPEQAGYKVIGFFSKDDPGYNKYKKSCRKFIERNATDIFAGIDPKRLADLVFKPIDQGMEMCGRRYPSLWAIDNDTDEVIGQMTGVLSLNLRNNERSWLKGSYGVLKKGLVGSNNFTTKANEEEILVSSGVVDDKDQRKKKIAATLMRIVLDYIKRNGAKFFAVTNDVTNRASEKLINSLGAWMPLRSGLTKDYPQGVDIPDYDPEWCFDTKEPITHNARRIVTRVIELN